MLANFDNNTIINLKIVGATSYGYLQYANSKILIKDLSSSDPHF